MSAGIVCRAREGSEQDVSAGIACRAQEGSEQWRLLDGCLCVHSRSHALSLSSRSLFIQPPGLSGSAVKRDSRVGEMLHDMMDKGGGLPAGP